MSRVFQVLLLLAPAMALRLQISSEEQPFLQAQNKRCENKESNCQFLGDVRFSGDAGAFWKVQHASSFLQTDFTPPAEQPVTIKVGDGDIEVKFKRLFGKSGTASGECRDSNGKYGMTFSRGDWTLRPHTEGENAQTATTNCMTKCAMHRKWCIAVQVVTRDVWPTPECRLVSDAKTFANAGMVLENERWGGPQKIDNDSYQTYCNGGQNGGKCDQSNWDGGSVYERDGYNCYEMHVPEDGAKPEKIKPRVMANIIDYVDWRKLQIKPRYLTTDSETGKSDCKGRKNCCNAYRKCVAGGKKAQKEGFWALGQFLQKCQAEEVECEEQNIQPAADTPNWDNNFGYSCDVYAKHWCEMVATKDGGEGGRFRAGSEWTGQNGYTQQNCNQKNSGLKCDEQHNYPQNNCVVCGKTGGGGGDDDDDEDDDKAKP